MATIQRESLGLVDRSTTQYAQDSICALLSSDILYNSDCDDQRVAAATAGLDDCVENAILLSRQSDGETLSHQELDSEARARYHNILIQDTALDGASLSQARSYFQSFAAPYITESEPESFGRSIRFRQFILLDDQVLSNLETAPKRGDIKAFNDLFGDQTMWVKLVDTDEEDLYSGSCAFNVRDLLDAYEAIGRLDRMTCLPMVEPPEGESELWTFCDLI